MTDDPWPDPNVLPEAPVPHPHPRFVICCVGWLTLRRGLADRGDEIRTMFATLIRFLQENGLTTRTILADGAPVADDVAIRMEDLTPEGDLLMRRPCDRWFAAFDRGQSPTDTKILERALAKIRTGKVGKYGE